LVGWVNFFLSFCRNWGERRIECWQVK
jgi:hypothetical protein